MLINLCSSIQYMRPLGPSFHANKIKEIINFVALAILCVCSVYIIYSYFWKQRTVQQQPSQNLANLPSPQVIDNQQASVKKEANDEEQIEAEERSTVDPHPSPLDDQNSLTQNETDSQRPKSKQIGKVSDESFADQNGAMGISDHADYRKVVGAAQQHPLASPKAGADGLDVLDDKSSDDALVPEKDLSWDVSLTVEENIERDVKFYCKQEESNHSYGGMFCRYEGVYASLKDLQKSGISHYVNFCNRAFANHFDTHQNRTLHWDLNLSIDPDQRFLAWKILSDVLEITPLSIKGLIYSSDKCEPGKAIVLQVVLTDENEEIELLQFLTLLTYHLTKEKIKTDRRPLSQEPLLGIIPTDGLSTYFNYGTDTYTVLKDILWEDFLMGRENVETIVEGKVVKLDNGHYMIRASHYRTLGDARVNPFKIPNPFEKLRLTSL